MVNERCSVYTYSYLAYIAALLGPTLWVNVNHAALIRLWILKSTTWLLYVFYVDLCLTRTCICVVGQGMVEV